MPNMWNGMGMDGMMGGSGYNGYGTTAPSYLWIIPVGLIGVGVISLIGVGFYLAFPQIRAVADKPGPPVAEERFLADAKNDAVVAAGHDVSSTPCEAVSKTLTPEELKVLNVLVAHQGKYLQKYIRKEAGLSRLKTHRIIARFAERGIVTLKQSGNTNEIYLAEWLKSPKQGSA